MTYRDFYFKLFKDRGLPENEIDMRINQTLMIMPMNLNEEIDPGVAEFMTKLFNARFDLMEVDPVYKQQQINEVLNKIDSARQSN